MRSYSQVLVMQIKSSDCRCSDEMKNIEIEFNLCGKVIGISHLTWFLLDGESGIHSISSILFLKKARKKVSIEYSYKLFQYQKVLIRISISTKLLCNFVWIPKTFIKQPMLFLVQKKSQIKFTYSWKNFAKFHRQMFAQKFLRNSIRIKYQECFFRQYWICCFLCLHLWCMKISYSFNFENFMDDFFVFFCFIKKLYVKCKKKSAKKIVFFFWKSWASFEFYKSPKHKFTNP